MKAFISYAIIINWSLSLFGLGVESVDGGLLAPVVGFAWFGISTLVLIRAQKRGILQHGK